MGLFGNKQQTPEVNTSDGAKLEKRSAETFNSAKFNDKATAKSSKTNQKGKVMATSSAKKYGTFGIMATLTLAGCTAVENAAVQPSSTPALQAHATASSSAAPSAKATASSTEEAKAEATEVKVDAQQVLKDAGLDGKAVIVDELNGDVVSQYSAGFGHFADGTWVRTAEDAHKFIAMNKESIAKQMDISVEELDSASVFLAQTTDRLAWEKSHYTTDEGQTISVDNSYVTGEGEGLLLVQYGAHTFIYRVGCANLVEVPTVTQQAPSSYIGSGEPAVPAVTTPQKEVIVKKVVECECETPVVPPKETVPPTETVTPPPTTNVPPAKTVTPPPTTTTTPPPTTNIPPKEITPPPSEKTIEVCEVATGNKITINEKDFDSSKHSHDFGDCTVVPPKETKDGKIDLLQEELNIEAPTTEDIDYTDQVMVNLEEAPGDAIGIDQAIQEDGTIDQEKVVIASDSGENPAEPVAENRVEQQEIPETTITIEETQADGTVIETVAPQQENTVTITDPEAADTTGEATVQETTEVPWAQDTATDQVAVNLPPQATPDGGVVYSEAPWSQAPSQETTTEDTFNIGAPSTDGSVSEGSNKPGHTTPGEPGLGNTQ